MAEKVPAAHSASDQRHEENNEIEGTEAKNHNAENETLKKDRTTKDHYVNSNQINSDLTDCDVQVRDNATMNRNQNGRSPGRSDRENRFRFSVGKERQLNDGEGGSAPVPGPGEALEAAFDRLGHFGFYQRYVLILLCIPNLLAVMYSLNYVFVADQVPFRCVVPECEGTWNVQFANASAAALQSEQACFRYRPLLPGATTCDRQHFHANDTVACDAFVYENMDTIYAEFGLACHEWRRTLVGTVRNAALPLALLLTGYLSDGWGRRTAFCVFAAFAGTLGLAKSFAVNYPMYLAMEFLEAALGYGFNSAAYVMMVELARPSLRAAFACATDVAYGAGGMLFALVASRVRYWRWLLRAIHAPALLLPLYWLLLDESARWLHATGRRERALAGIRKAARWNKVILNEDLITALNEPAEEGKGEAKPASQWRSLVCSRVLMARFAAVAWCWVAAAFVYYGLTINSVSLAGDKYVNFALNMAMEVVASLLIMMALERFGRKRSIVVSFALCGVACVVPYFVSHARAGLALFFAGKLAITFAFNSLYVFTAELFPTPARSSALAAASLAGRLGSTLAPQTPLLGVYVQALLYGGCSLSAALAVLLAPETRRAALPARVLDAERLHATPATPVPPAPPAAPSSPPPAAGARSNTRL